MGNFASMAHPLVDSVELTVQRINNTQNDTFIVSFVFHEEVRSLTVERYLIGQGSAPPLTTLQTWHHTVQTIALHKIRRMDTTCMGLALSPCSNPKSAPLLASNSNRISAGVTQGGNLSMSF